MTPRPPVFTHATGGRARSGQLVAVRRDAPPPPRTSGP